MSAAPEFEQLSPTLRMLVRIDPWAVRGCTACDSRGVVPDDDNDADPFDGPFVDCEACSGTRTRHCEAAECCGEVTRKIQSGVVVRVSCGARSCDAELLLAVMEEADRLALAEVKKMKRAMGRL